MSGDFDNKSKEDSQALAVDKNTTIRAQTGPLLGRLPILIWLLNTMIILFLRRFVEPYGTRFGGDMLLPSLPKIYEFGSVEKGFKAVASTIGIEIIIIPVNT